MSFITIVQDDEDFEWSPIDETSGEKSTSVFMLRIVSDEVDERLRKENTRPVAQKRGPMVKELNQPKYIAAVIDYAITGWRNLKDARTGADVACTTAIKTRLPENVKADVLRLCSGKEAGEVVAAAEQEKKDSKII